MGVAVIIILAACLLALIRMWSALILPIRRQACLAMIITHTHPVGGETLVRAMDAPLKAVDPVAPDILPHAKRLL
jgi:hypothetical protein